MAARKRQELLGQIHVLFSAGTFRDLTDGQLLQRFATVGGEAGEAAFAILIERHGPMVLRVCKGLLVDPHDTQDAFQATFLVLVQKARELWVRDSLGPWLHQVAYRTASSARSSAARRQRHERRFAVVSEGTNDETDDELIRILHEEIHRLPERYRAPIVLCELGGRTCEQAALQLGWPVGTIKSRLSRARRRLRDRLTGRGATFGTNAMLISSLQASLPSHFPVDLVEVTTSGASQFLRQISIPRGPASALAHGVIRAMNIGRGLKLAAVFLALGVTVTSAQLLVGRQTTQNGGGSDGRANPPSNQTTAVMEIKRGTLRVNVVERGSIVSGQNLDVLNAVEGESIIRGIVPEGTYVKKGDLVCELDSSTLKDQLRNQEATTNQAKRNLEEARNELEVADLEQRAFEQIELPLRKESIEGRIALGKVELELRKSQAEQVERMPEATALMKAESRLAVLRAEQGLKEAQGQLRLLQEFTRESETRRHQIKSTKARTHVLASEAAFQLEKSKTDKLQQQIAKCKLTAPADGLVVYASAPVASPGGRRFMIEEGATVRERQVIFSLFDPKTPARVMVKAREAIVDRLVPGLRAQVKVDAFADLVLSGTVQSVAPLPDPSNQFATQGRKVYSTLILLDKAFPSLRPGMTAQADILVKELNHVLTVPVQALLPRGNKYKIAVRKPDGSFTWRDVTLGMANDTHVEIKAGLNPGDVVSLAPLELLQDQAPTRPTPPAQPGEGRQP